MQQLSQIIKIIQTYHIRNFLMKIGVLENVNVTIFINFAKFH